MIKTRTAAWAAAALAMSMAASAFAQDRHGAWEGRGSRHDGAAYATVPPGPQQRMDMDRQDRGFRGRHDHFRIDRYGRVAPPDLRAARQGEWRRGGDVPREYRGARYVVTDWRSQRLQAPPRGYQWVGDGGSFALAAIATGLIAQVIAAH